MNVCAPRIRHHLGAVLGICLLSLSSHAQDLIRLANHQLQLGIDPGSGRLAEIIDPRSGHNFAVTSSIPNDLWAVDYITQGVTRTLTPASAQDFECRRLPGTTQRWQMTWSRFSDPEAAALRVEVILQLAGDEPAARGEIAIFKSPGQAIAQVKFPRLSEIPVQPHEFLAVPVWAGELLTQPRSVLNPPGAGPKRIAWDYPGRLSLQCITLYQENGPGLYLACDDPHAFRKTFAVQGAANYGIALEVSHLPENEARGLTRYAPDYGVVIGVIHGSWVAAAERYRQWGAQQRWARESRLRTSATPEWVQQTALWVWNRGKSEGVLGPAAILQQELGLPVSVLWHWWHGCAYDAGFPEYLPPREGAESFRRAVEDANRTGLNAIVYMNQRLWGMSTQSWVDEGAERFAVKGPDGTFRREVYNTFTRQACVSMCMGTTSWRNKYAGIAEIVLKDHGVAGIYMDQACTSLACFDSTHGHSLGGGRYWMAGFRQLSEDIRQRLQTLRPPALAGEGTGEAWLPYLDLMLSLQVSKERYAQPAEGWEPIPFFQAVYHPYAIQFGNYSSLTMPPYDELWPAESAPAEPLQLLDRKYSSQFRLEQARAFVWGQQPMLANFLPSQLQERAAEIAYVLRLARLRHQALPYLLHGEFLAPPRFAVPKVQADLSRLSIYAGQKGGLTHFSKELPLVVAGAWRAPDGNVAVTLASIAAEALDLTLAFDPLYYRVNASTPVFQVDAFGRKPLHADASTGVLQVTLGAEAACLIEFVRH